jgi:transposase
MAGKKGQKKRFWSDEEKVAICVQTYVPEVSVAQVARRYSMNTNLIHKWLRDPRFAPAAQDHGYAPDDDAVFLPVEVSTSGVEDTVTAPTFAVGHEPGEAIQASRVDITLSDGRRVVVEGSTALSAVVGLVQGLMA